MKEVTKLKIYGALVAIAFIFLWFVLRTISRGSDGTYRQFQQNPTAILVTAGGFLILVIVLLIIRKRNPKDANMHIKLPTRTQ